MEVCLNQVASTTLIFPCESVRKDKIIMESRLTFCLHLNLTVVLIKKTVCIHTHWNLSKAENTGGIRGSQYTPKNYQNRGNFY